MTRVAVLGAGAWGTALACSFARVQPDIRLWGREAGRLAAIEAARQNVPALPGVTLPPHITATSDLEAAVTGTDILVVAVPAQEVRSVLADARLRLPAGIPLVLCAKGIERTSGCFLSDVAAACRPDNPAAILSGPSFASDVGRGRPTAVTVAATSLAQAAALGATLGSATLRLYHTDDVRGVEIGGAAKNVLAIACGIAHGRGLGPSAGAALVARAFAELSRFGRAFGARPDTLAGLSGLGDLVLTCGSAQSRNFSFGEALGRGGSALRDADGPVVEGVWTAEILVALAERAGVDMPICRSVAGVLSGTLDIAGAIEQLLNRPFRPEA